MTHRNSSIVGRGSVRSWRHCLDVAGVREAAAHADYFATERYLRRRSFNLWGTVRGLAPPESQPHLIATAAFLRYTDDLCDRGPMQERAWRFEEWAGHVRKALDTGSSRHRLLRAYLHSADLLNLPRTWLDSYVEGTRFDLDFPGFAQEADYQRYVDEVALPSGMVVFGPVPRLVAEQDFVSSCRLFADGGQRADFLSDLFEDLRDGRLFLPISDLDRHGVTRTDLTEGRDTSGVRALISSTARSARASLDEAERILGEIPPDHRPFLRFFLCLFHKRLDDVGTRGPALIRSPYHDGRMASLRVIVRSRREGASTRAHPVRRERTLRQLRRYPR